MAIVRKLDSIKLDRNSKKYGGVSIENSNNSWFD